MNKPSKQKSTMDGGYILELHRILYGKSQSSLIQRRVHLVFLQHKLLDTVRLFLQSDIVNNFLHPVLYNRPFVCENKKKLQVHIGVRRPVQ